MDSRSSGIDDAAFPFYRLTAELRCSIFRYATIDIVTVDGVLARGCRVQLLLVSRRFKAEYEANVYRHARLTRHSERHPDGRVLRGLDNMHLLQHLTLRVLLYYGDVVPFQQTLNEAQRDLQVLLSALPALRTLHVQLDLDSEDVRMMIDDDDRNRAEYVQPDDVTALLNLFTPQLSVTGGNADDHNIVISQEVVLNGHLSEATAAAARHQDWNTVPWPTHKRQNSVRFRGTPSTGPYAFCGLQLEMIGASSEVNPDQAFLDYEEYQRLSRV
ncbi:hypothetical protein LTR02_012569 [Friedmanniomyces endolithicus]|nr:hypothetical protein LTR94_015780 [Friedmanniomyces endolithicus]KAK0785453.1 hypothetical protein LTR59_011020 [Friedmanniomyces endolithicus]KAK0811359.1 hypothetical protein LTR38_003687 [Friedmanniomyces endolithicus]KAK0817917.1 hypothetical protein LTR75_002846 [Friedmanniomyces endolithicus]KAK0836756.1 hypothetical protein LTR03_013384 [Friedmanniomyces endolithicus]